ncbi:heterokaryon incompatibility protein-domain-containing protein [Nemania sp. NC0429]|nr:heterokaryon incompatibility protein-domain-containing protein [Nemania sp. NC0429]
MSPLFMYPPLVERDHIRVILLQPAAARDHKLVASFQHFSLNDHSGLIDPYTALSYVWGDPTPVDNILLDGQELGITASLGAALRDIRDGDDTHQHTHRLWADAVCIDQHNIPERNHQVALMGQIYSRAGDTVIHLGPLTPQAEIIVHAVLQWQDAENSLIDEELIIRTTKEWLVVQPWFHRVWVLQELVLSRKAWVQFGPKRISWHYLCSHLTLLLLRDRLAGEDNMGPTVLESMNEIFLEHLKERISSSPKETRQRKLSQLLFTRNNCGATDLRDLVFAHLGIISDRKAALEYIKIDYN